LLLDLYLSFNLEDKFFDIVFNLKINNSSYNFTENKYNDENYPKKIMWLIAFIFANAFILFFCFYALVFIIIPIIYFRIGQFSKSNPRLSERIYDNSNKISLLEERFTNDN
jgi:hypothetical protein